MVKDLTKSKDRIRNHGEVFTPDFVVENMLDLVKDETERIDSRFLEPACGDGNFLIKILARKLKVVVRKYKKNQFDYERNSLIAVSSIYGVDLLDDNVQNARERLYNFFENRYEEIYKTKINQEFLENIEYIISKNIVQGDALTLKNKENQPIVFSEWSAINGIKIKRRDFSFANILSVESSRVGLFEELDKDSFFPEPIKEYDPINFLNLKNDA